MSEKIEALRLAEFCDGNVLYQPAAAELRRLHEQNQRFYAQHASVVSDYEKAVVALKAQRDALLEALNQCLKGTLIGGHTHNDNGLEVLAERCGSPHVATELRRLAGIARAAIKAVEEGK